MAVESFDYSPETGIRDVGSDIKELSFSAASGDSTYFDALLEQAIKDARKDIQSEGSIFPAMGFTYTETEGKVVIEVPSDEKLNRLSGVTGYNDGRSFAYATTATTSSREYLGGIADNIVTISPDPNFMLHDTMFHNFLFLPPRALKIIRDESIAALATDDQSTIDAYTGTVDALTGGETSAHMLNKIYRRKMGSVAASVLAIRDMRTVNKAKSAVRRKHD